MWKRTRSAQRGNDRFAARRRLRRRRALTAAIIFILFLLVGGVYALNQSFLRITRVQVFGVDSTSSPQADEELAPIAKNAMQGSYLGIIPRDSIFFYPDTRIRTDIIAEYPDIAAVSLSRDGLTGLSIRVSRRVAIAQWCGLAPTAGVEAYCYVFDASGLIYATAASSTHTLNTFILYASLSSATEEPLGATLPNAHTFPSAFDFAREIGTFGSPVVSVVYREGEVDDTLASGTRITYVLGNEQNAFTALISARANINLTDGSIEYIDLRFDGKVYLKRKDDIQK